MRKIFAFVLALVCTINLSAAINSKLGIYMYSESYDYLEEAVLLGAGDTYAPFNASACASYFGVGSNTNNYAAYVSYGGADYSELYAPKFINLPLTVVTSRDVASKQQYTFYIELNGAANNSQPVYLTDLRAPGGPQTVELTDMYEYTFDLKDEAAYVEGTNSVIADRFVINYAAAVTSLTTNAYGWASFSYGQDLEAVDFSLKIYTGEFDGASTLNLNEVDYVKADQGVVVYGVANTTYYFVAGTGASVYGTNHLMPTSAFDPNNYSNVFVLQGDALYEYVGTNALAANKAYLQLPGGSSAPQRIRMVINEAQAVENVAVVSEKAVKFVENGEILIKRGENVYNMQGQIVK